MSIPKKVQAIVFDFDGVFTDNRVIINEDGKESVICNRSDGLGISEIRKSNISLLVLSKETNNVVLKRCEKLQIPCFHGIDNKKEFLAAWLKEQAINKEDVIYIGNDVNDIGCLQYVGCGVVVADAHREAKSYAKVILKNNGGQGAVRELCDMVMSRNKKR